MALFGIGKKKLLPEKAHALRQLEHPEEYTVRMATRGGERKVVRTVASSREELYRKLQSEHRGFEPVNIIGKRKLL